MTRFVTLGTTFLLCASLCGCSEDTKEAMKEAGKANKEAASRLAEDVKTNVGKGLDKAGDTLKEGADKLKETAK